MKVVSFHLCPLEDITNEIEQSEDIVARIIDCQRQIEESRKTVDLQVPLVVASSFAAYVQPDQHNTHTTSNSVKPRLSKLSLPKFRGDITRWQSFWDSFKSAIHENSDISTIDKFNYLNSLLEGNAARTVQGLILTSSNYNAAVEMLQERYGKPQLMISAHKDEILKIQPCMEGGRLGPLRYVYDKISVHVRGLSAMGVSSKEYGSLLIPIIMSRLPSDVRLQISRSVRMKFGKLRSFSTPLSQKLMPGKQAKE